MKKILIIVAIFMLACSFSQKKKALKVQEWTLESYKTNEAGEVVYIKYTKVGKPKPMHDSDLHKVVYSIVQ
jgi:hypothetical protein